MLQETFETVLRELHVAAYEINASAIVAVDGIPISFMLDKGMNPDRVGGMCSALLSLGTRSAHELACGKLKQVIVEGDDGFILMVQAAKDMILLMSARHDAKLGMILLHAKDTVKKIQQLA